ncbi:hypothetical protein [Amycolatopsis magusensis]|uniref:hypothetical protein n=1 Tax=Amycolatopsis magusensis TaxID=882444 RepID=UPI003C2B6F0C
MRQKASRLAIATAGLGLALSLTACGADQPAANNTAAPTPAPSAASPAPSSAAAADAATGAWVNDFCGALSPLAELGQLQPPEMQPGDLAGARSAVGDFLGKIEGSVGPVVDDLEKLGTAPMQAGEDAKASVLELFKPVRDEAKSAKEKLDAAPASDANAVKEAATSLQNVGQGLQKASTGMSSAKGTAEVEAAGKDQPNCQKLNG